MKLGTWQSGALCKNLARVRIWGLKVKVTGDKNEKVRNFLRVQVVVCQFCADGKSAHAV